MGKKLACVNAATHSGSLNMDAYGVFEREAFPLFRTRYERALENGVECVTSPAIQRKFGAGGIARNRRAGYRDRDRRMPGTKVMPSGVIMVNYLAKFKRPDVIHLVGFDGYTPQNSGMDQKWCDRLNAASSKHIAIITNLHKKVRFVIHGSPNYPNQEKWRVEYAGKAEEAVVPTRRQRVGVQGTGARGEGRKAQTRSDVEASDNEGRESENAGKTGGKSPRVRKRGQNDSRVRGRKTVQVPRGKQKGADGGAKKKSRRKRREKE